MSKFDESRFDFAKDPTPKELMRICDDADKAKARAKAAQKERDAAFVWKLVQDERHAPLQRQGSDTAQQVAQDRLLAEKLMHKPVSSSSKPDEFTPVGPRRRSQH